MDKKDILKKALNIINIFSYLYIYLSILIFCINSIFIYILLKHKPIACIDNPKNIIFNILDGLFTFLFTGLFFIIPVILVSTILIFIFKLDKNPYQKIIFNLICIIIIILLFIFDPFGYLYWFFD